MAAFALAFTQFFSMFATLFSAGERTASAVNNIATWADESSAAFADEARILRQQKLLHMNAQTQAIAANPLAIPAPTQQQQEPVA